MPKRRKQQLDHPELGLPEVKPLWAKQGLFSDHYLKQRMAKNHWWHSNDRTEVLAIVDEHVNASQIDAIHDLLGFLAEQMITINRIR